VTAEGAQQRLADLLARTALGDRAAFAQLYVATRAKLFAVSLRIVRERALAEEALQDSFVAIWHHAADYARIKGAPTTWMAAIVRNRSLDLVRRAREMPDVDDALAAQPDIVEKVRGGNQGPVGAIIGAVMKATKGQADAKRVRELVLDRIGQ